MGIGLGRLCHQSENCGISLQNRAFHPTQVSPPKKKRRPKARLFSLTSLPPDAPLGIHILHHNFLLLFHFFPYPPPPSAPLKTATSLPIQVPSLSFSALTQRDISKRRRNQFYPISLTLFLIISLFPLTSTYLPRFALPPHSTLSVHFLFMPGSRTM